MYVNVGSLFLLSVNIHPQQSSVDEAAPKDPGLL